ncbi:hypothetical protein NBRC110019_25370 [Neptunitalea chrysea]|uniref:DUF1593 domain-containing protein n=1 Tax=Neptunitalea chrysea TaxID=1647581 RepID=A0A9W6EVX5_9FLAO|nr:nucleoside hydrolase-like domain-containing protein [Neptunitalea chrysea]GLB53496.1 hypothetical protein NBRC110019_25370 [Neptunitalea chrysea]
MKFIFSFFIICIIGTSHAQTISKTTSLKPRIIVLTDVSTWETDDSESLVRLLVHADLFEIEGIVYTTGWSLDKTRDDFFGLIHEAIDAYEKDFPNLIKRSGQKKFKKHEEKQFLGYWPSADYLRSRTVKGSKNRGLEFIGEGNDSDGSDLILKLAQENDDRPLWVLAWGGGNTLAQALWKAKHTLSPEYLQKVLAKIRFYTITDQDREQKTSYEISSHQWMRKTFGKNLFFIWDESAWGYQNGTGRQNWDQYAAHIQGHGNLGNVYPKYKYGVEGDTPSFLYVLPNGLNNPENPQYGGWGGYFEWMISDDKKTYAYTNYSPSLANQISGRYEAYFYPAIFNNFSARMDWAKDGIGNRNPIVIVDKIKGLQCIQKTPIAGSQITLNASESFDPDGDNLTFKWWVLTEAGTYTKNIKILNSNTATPTVSIPADSADKTFHIICEVTDSGVPSLTSYRRILFKPTK